jgi:hypothetical protein
MSATEYAITLEDFEAIVDGGVRRVSWHVADGEDWIAAAQYAGASVEMADRSPGVVWRRSMLLRLSVGTRLMRVESLPQPRAGQKDPVSYLWGPPRASSQQVQRRYFTVDLRGRLERESPTRR